MAFFKSGKHDAKAASEAEPEAAPGTEAASEPPEAPGEDEDAPETEAEPDSEEAPEAEAEADDAAAEKQAMDALYSEPEAAPLEELEVIGPDDEAEDAQGADGADAAQADSAAEPARKSRKSRGKAAAIVVGVFVLLLAAVYCGGAFYFQSHFMPNTVVNGQDVSGMSVEDLARQVSDTGASYSARVTGDGLDLTIDGKDVGLSYDGDAYAQDAVDQTRVWMWPFEVAQSRSLTVNRQISIDEDELKALVRPKVTKLNRDGTDPTNATVAYDSSTQGFAVQAEELGTKVELSAVLEKIADGMRELDASIELGDSELKQPQVTSDDERLASAAEQANAYLDARVPLTVNGKTVMTVEPVQVAEWVTIDSDFNAKLDTDAIKAWALGPAVSGKFDTIGAKRTYKRADGKKVTVSGGTYGWSTDSEKLATRLAKRIKAGSSKKLEIPMKARAAKWNPGGADWKAYIDIDLSEQKARYYNAKGKVIWSSDIVSGTPSTGHATPTGVYVINNTMGTDQTLIGTDADGDGEPDYESHVDYWMPFVGNLVALHDADWRSSFGGTIYLTNGSHGCVNLPPAKAKELYSMVKPGVVVSCHK